MPGPDMSVAAQIDAYIAAQPERKRDDMRALHRLILGLSPDCRTWFLDGKDGDGRIVSNPNIGYGEQRINYAGGKTRTFYRVGLSANTAGISIYIIGIKDKRFLSEAYGARLGKANVSGYCIKFRTLQDIDLDVLEEVIRFGLEARHDEGDR
jgi:hypothetical protein